MLYSVTFNNDLDRDLATLEAYGTFRREAAELGVRHFLEVFNPNALAGHDPSLVVGVLGGSAGTTRVPAAGGRVRRGVRPQPEHLRRDKARASMPRRSRPSRLPPRSPGSARVLT